MVSCLLVSSNDKSTLALTQLLKSRNVNIITTAKSSSEARRCLGVKEFDIVVINTPLSDEFGYDLTFTITKTTDSGVVLLIKNDILNENYNKLYEYGAMCIAKPMDRMLFQQGIHMAIAMHYRIAGLSKEKLKLETKLEEVRYIDRAKCALIEYLNMSESDAHHYIEKRAMDLRTTKVKVAKEILKIYE